MAEEKEYGISDVYGWFTPLTPSTDEDIKIQITKNSITIFFDGPSDWMKRRGRFEKLGKNLFVLLPDEMTDATGADRLSKAPCPIYSVRIRKYGWRDDGRLAVFIPSYRSMEGLRAGNICFGESYIPIDKPFDRPTN